MQLKCVQIHLLPRMTYVNQKCLTLRLWHTCVDYLKTCAVRPDGDQNRRRRQVCWRLINHFKAAGKFSQLRRTTTASRRVRGQQWTATSPIGGSPSFSRFLRWQTAGPAKARAPKPTHRPPWEGVGTCSLRCPPRAHRSRARGLDPSWSTATPTPCGSWCKPTCSTWASGWTAGTCALGRTRWVRAAHAERSHRARRSSPSRPPWEIVAPDSL